MDAATPTPTGSRDWKAAVLAWWPTLRRVLAVAVPLVVLAVVWGTLRQVDYAQLRADVANADRVLLLAALGVSFLAVASMGLYDVVAFPPTPTLGWRKRWLLGSAIFGWSNLITLGPVGPAIRVFLYRREGVTPARLSAGFVAYYAGIAAGMAAWFAAAWLVRPAGPGRGWLAAPLALTLSVAFTVVAGTLVRRLGRGRVWARSPALRASRLPRLGAVAFLDWGLTVLALQLAAQSVGLSIDLARAARVLLSGHAVGFLSLVPGGLGSADAVWLRMLSTGAAAASDAPATIVVFRAVFYLAPWAAAMAVFYVLFSRAGGAAGRWQRRTLAAATGVLAGLVLLSVATPAGTRRLPAAAELFSLPAVEAGQAVAVVAALALLALTRGLVRGHRAAWAGACVALAAAAAGLVLKGLDVEEALAAVGLLTVLGSARGAFPRTGRVPVGWRLSFAVGVAVVAALGVLGLLSHGVRFPSPLSFGVEAEASRFTRALCVGAAAGGALLLREALRPAAARPGPTPEEAAAAARFAERCGGHPGPAEGEAWYWLGGTHPAEAAFSGDPAAAADAAALLRVHREAGALVVLGEPLLTPAAEPAALLAALRARARDEDLDLILHRLGRGWLGPLRAAGFHLLKLPERGDSPPLFLAHRSLWGGSHARVRAEAAARRHA